MKQIPLTNNTERFAIVSDEDFDWLMQWKWYAIKVNRGKTWYAVRANPNHNKTNIRMHRQILGLSDPKVFADHIDQNGLNNQRSNLRKCGNGQNKQNSEGSRNRKSLYKGVYYHVSRKHWRATIGANNKKYYFSGFNTEIEAAKAYDAKARELHGEFACLNFPD